MSAATIFVVDDDEAVRDSLQAVLEAKGYQSQGFATAEAFLAAYRPGSHECALVDLQMPGMDGLALLERLRSGGVRLPIVMVTGHGDIQLAVKAIRLGASDFVEKPYSNQAILDAVQRAVGSTTAEPGDAATQQAMARVDGLTPRELDVLRQLVTGNANKIIAYELKISPRTVEIHRANLMRKMQADSLSHLVRMAIAAGVQPSSG